MAGRVIVHVDMDAFFAAIAQRDDPALRGRPVIVGGHSVNRGVVASASYEARAHGIRSAMPIHRAIELCPHAVRVPVQMETYREVHRELVVIWQSFSPLVESVAFDEAYLDLTGCERLMGPVEGVARRLRERILAVTRLSASVGAGSSKLMAKVASKAAKPAGVLIIPTGDEEAWLHPRPVSLLPGVGPRMQEKLARLGIHTVGQLAHLDWPFLEAHFGEAGLDLHRMARGHDPRPVQPGGPPKSVGGERTFERDSADPVFLRRTLLDLACDVAYRLRRYRLAARTVTVKVRDGKTFQTLERSMTLTVPTQDEDILHGRAWDLLGRAWEGQRALRLVGLSTSGLVHDGQLALFETGGREGKQALLKAIDGLRSRHGAAVVRRAACLSEKE
jgi:DNA polymerase-4